VLLYVNNIYLRKGERKGVINLVKLQEIVLAMVYQGPKHSCACVYSQVKMP